MSRSRPSHSLLAVLLGFSPVLLVAQDVSSPRSVPDQPVFASAVEAVPTVLERGPHHRVESWMERVTLEDGSVQDVPHSYTVLATGMHWRESEDAEWQDTVAEFVPVAGGFVAARGPHQVAVSDDLFVEGAVTVVSPEGVEWRSTPLSLALRDGRGNVVVLAEARATKGELVAPNTVLFSQAFAGLDASVRVVYSAAGVESDVVIHERLPDPALLGLDSATTEVVVLTEVYGPAPTTVERHEVGQAASLASLASRTDATVHLGSLRLDRGRAFTVDNGAATGGPEAAVVKELYEQEGRIFLEEAAKLDALAPLFESLPEASLPNPLNDRWRTTAQLPNSALRIPHSALKRPSRAAEFARRSDGRLAAAAIHHSPSAIHSAIAAATRPGVVLDWSYVNTSTLNFLAGQTYFVTGPVVLGTGSGSTVRFEGSAVIKYAPTGSPSLTIASGTAIVWEGRPYAPVILTARDDNSVGEAVTGSTGNPNGVYATKALSVNGSGRTTPLVLANLHVRHANLGVEAVYFDTSGPLTLRHAQFVNCAGAVKFQLGSTTTDTYFLQNALIANGTTLFKDSYYARVRADFITANNVTNFRQSQYSPDYSTIAVHDSVLTAVGNVTGDSNCYKNASATDVYASAGAGDHYLAPLSPARHNLDNGNNKASRPLTEVAADAVLATTTAPLPLATTYSGNHTLTAWLSSGEPWTRGYHYWPLDYSAIGTTTTYAASVSGGTVTFQPGAAPDGVRVGFGGPKGIRVQAAGEVIFAGNPVGQRILTNRLVRLTAVQENPLATAAKVTSASLFQLEQSAVLSVSAADVSLNTAPPGVRPVLTMTTGAYAPTARFRDVWFRRASWSVAPTQASPWPALGVTNCVFDGCSLYVANAWGPGSYDRAPVEFKFRNNRLIGGTLTLTCYSSHVSNWELTDNLFEGTTILAGSYAGPNSYNAFSAATGFPNNGAGTLLGVAMNWVTQPDGRQYYPTTDTAGNDLWNLRNAGTSGGVSGRGLRFYTTDGPAEGTTALDIGFHHAAGSGDQWLDTDQDGLADAAEDADGDGVVDTGETDPANADSDQDGVLDGEELAAGTDPNSKTSWIPKRLAAWKWETDDPTPVFTKLGDRGQAPLTGYASNGTEATGVVQKAAHFSNPATSALRYAVREPNGRLNARLDHGTIKLWFKPDWTWAERANSADRRIFEVGNFGDANTGLWSILFRERALIQGGTVAFRLELWQGNGSGGESSRYWLPLNSSGWETVKWHELAMAYRAERTVLLVDGGINTYSYDGYDYSSGYGVDPANLPPITEAVTLGSALAVQSNGQQWGPLGGTIDSLETFNYPLGEVERYALQQLTIQIVTNAGARQLEFTRRHPDTRTNAHFVTPWPLTLWRRPLGGTNWGAHFFTNSVAETWTDTNVTAGTTYEYKAEMIYSGSVYVVRHFFAGIEMPPAHRRGNVILVVDSTLEPQLTAELATLKTNLVGDGWTVTSLVAPRHDDLNWSVNTNNLPAVAANIVNAAQAGTTNVVFLIGHVTIPYSGMVAPDGHGDHYNAWVADGYYGYLSKAGWTDTHNRTNAGFTNIVNVADDGKLDPDHLVTRFVNTNYSIVGRLPDMAVGRVDFARMPAFSGFSEVDLIKRYLAKDGRYRTNGTPPSGRVSLHLGNAFGNLAVQSAQSFAGAAFGVEPGRVFNGANLVDKIPADLGVHFRYGDDDQVHNGLNSDHLAIDFANPAKELPVTFRQVWFSYASDWARLDETNRFVVDNNWLRASLGWTNHGLATMGGTAWDFAPLGGGAPLAATMTHGWEGQFAVHRFQSILGDPTLRLFRVAPPASLKATRNGSNVALTWNPSPEATQGYYVYRSTTGLNGFTTPLNSVPVLTPSYTDTTSVTNLLYQVRAVKLQVTGSGSFHNLSQGTFITVP